MNSQDWIIYSDDDERLKPSYPFVAHDVGLGWVFVYDEQEGKQIACKVWDDHEDNLWHWVNDGGTWLYYVTHWMPLPDDPEV